MGYQVYEVGARRGGYGVPAICEHPDCNEEIDRGISYACGGEPFSEYGCDRYFCGKHLHSVSLDEDGNDLKDDASDEEYDEATHVEVCERCKTHQDPFPYKKEHKDRVKHLLKDSSWKERRKNNKEEVSKMKLEMKVE